MKNLALGILLAKYKGSFVALSKAHVLESRELFHKLNVTFMISCQSLYIVHASKGMSNWNWISVQYSMFYPSYTTIINGKAKLFKYQFDVGNLSFMDFPAFTFCKGCEGRPGGW